MLKIENLSKIFGDHKAVDDLSFEVKDKEVFGLLGRNGAGKSTTIKMILGLVEPSSGSITWKGIPMGEAKVSIGYLPEERGLYTKSKVSTQLSYFGQLEGMSVKEADAAIDKWLARLEISEYKNKRVSELSKGNQQKIQLIATLLHNPELVILDEPFSGLDPVNSLMFAEVIQEEIDKGKTVIMSSHRMDMVESFVEEVTLLKRGKAVVHGSLQEIKNGYKFRNLVLGNDEAIKARLAQSGIEFEEDKNTLLVKVVEDSQALNVLNSLAASGISMPQFQLLQPTLEQIFIERVG